MDLDIVNQQLITLQKEKQAGIVCLHSERRHYHIKSCQRE